MKLFLLAVLLLLTPLAGAAEGSLRSSGVPAGVLLAGVVPTPPTGQESGAAAMASDEDFLTAREAFRDGDAAQLDRIAARFAQSPLEPYLTYYQLHMHLENANAAIIKQFLGRPQDTPVIDRLRGEWLKQLGQKQQWETFTEEYPHLVNEDAELTCYALQARRRMQEQEALVEARRLWFSGEAQPEDCMPLFDAALADGVISEDDVWQRIRLALEAGNVSLAGQLSAKLPAQRTLSLSALNKARSNPGRYLSSAKLEKSSAAGRMVAMFALQRLAKQSPQLAFARWEKIAAYYSETEQRYFYGWLGYEASRAQDSRALGWYQQAAGTQLTAPQLAWRARAAMRLLDWREVLASISAMEPEQQREKAWRYWKGRALNALGWHIQAQALFTALSAEYGYYGQLAAEEMEVAPSFATAETHLPDQAEIEKVLAQPGIQRALALYRMELDTEASREWAWAVHGYNDKQLLAAAEIAHRHEIYDRSIDTAERTQQLHDFNLRYPAPYRVELQEYVHDNDLDEAWVYGLMRQESRFTTRAKSTVGAAGLMQIMPATARWAAHRLGMRGYRTALIHELGTNLKLGTYYLKTVLSQFGNNPVLASAAYNAGPNRAQQWRGNIPLEGAIYIETIPFDETRDYVRKVMSNTVYYARLFGQPAASLKQRLGTVAPKKKISQAALDNER
jgi:soluble lytic murein transglycosylase